MVLVIFESTFSGMHATFHCIGSHYRHFSYYPSSEAIFTELSGILFRMIRNIMNFQESGNAEAASEFVSLYSKKMSSNGDRETGIMVM